MKTGNKTACIVQTIPDHNQRKLEETLNQDSSNLALEGQCTAEFSSNPDQNPPTSALLMITYLLFSNDPEDIRCVSA